MNAQRFISQAAMACLLFLSLALPACGGGGGGGGAQGGAPDQVADDRPLIVSTFPAADAQAVPVNTSIRILFATDLDPAGLGNVVVNIEDNLGNTYVGGVDSVSARELSVRYGGVLRRNTRVTVILQPGLADVDGNVRSTPFSFSFDMVQAIEAIAAEHETENDDMEVVVHRVNANGDGLTIMKRRGINPALLYRAFRGGVPTGQTQAFLVDEIPFNGRTKLDIAPNGDGQLTWTYNDGVDTELHAMRYDAATDSWQARLLLTPGAITEARDAAAKANNFGSVVAWLEGRVGDDSFESVLVGYPEADDTMEEPIVLELLDASRTAIKLATGGNDLSVAWVEQDASGGHRVAVRSRNGSAAFASKRILTPFGRLSRIHALTASPTGHRHLLFSITDASDILKRQLFLAVANPGESFLTATPLYATYEALGLTRMQPHTDGSVVVAYGRADLANGGTYVVRYRPGTGIVDTQEITNGDGYASYVTARGLNLALAPNGTAYAITSIRGGSLGRSAVRAAILPVTGDPILNIPVDANEFVKNTRGAYVVAHPLGGAMLAWTHANGNPGDADDDVRYARLSASGVVGPVTYLAQEDDGFIVDVALCIGTASRGTLVWGTYTQPVSEVRHYIFDE